MRRAAALTFALAALAGGCAASRAAEPAAPQPPAPARESGSAEHVRLERIASGLVRPTWVGAAPGDHGGLYVLEQPGRLVRLDRRGGATTVLDLRREVRTGAEQGLLGLAFHPGFARNGRLYLHWSDRAGDTRVAQFALRGDRVDRRRRRELLHVDQPEDNHNGGQLAFGPDGRLYLGLGDGGGAFDTHDTAQERDALLGKLVSADVDAPGRPGWRVELSGLRNPWRFAFDPGLNEVWIGDVGQDQVEEVDRVALEPDEPPKNLGWPAYEGARRLDARRLEAGGELVFPVAAYTHDDGCSITGGVVYRGADLPALSGRYVYGDFCTGTLWTLRPRPGGGAEDVRRERARRPQLTHIGTDADGELVLAAADGDVSRVVSRRVRVP